MLFQKICVKVSRTIKNQIKPKDEIYIDNTPTAKNIVLNIVLESYKRKYGIKIAHNRYIWRKYNLSINTCTSRLDWWLDIFNRYKTHNFQCWRGYKNKRNANISRKTYT